MELRPSFDEDLDLLYALATNDACFWWRSSFLGQPTPGNIVAKLEHDCVMLYVAESEGERVGASSLYEYSKQSDTVWLDVVMIPAYRYRRHEATSLALDAAFANWSARKVYALHHEFESSPFEGLSCQWQQEGHLAGRLRRGGRYWDQFICSVYRDDWRAAAGPPNVVDPERQNSTPMVQATRSETSKRDDRNSSRDGDS